MKVPPQYLQPMIYASIGLVIGGWLGFRPREETASPVTTTADRAGKETSHEQSLRGADSDDARDENRVPASLLSLADDSGLKPLTAQSTLSEVKSHVSRMVGLANEPGVSDHAYWAAGKKLVEYIQAHPDRARAAYEELLVENDSATAPATRAYVLESAWEIPELKPVALRTAPKVWESTLAAWKLAKSDDDLALPQMALKIELESLSPAERARVHARRLEQVRAKKDPYLLEMVRGLASSP